MGIRRIYGALMWLGFGISSLLVAGFLFTSLRAASPESGLAGSLMEIPNYNYVLDIEELKDKGNLREALELARYVTRHPDMPGQREARKLEQDLEKKVNSIRERTKRALRGFVTGSGSSMEEVLGGITSDLFIYGDVRDLVKQGFNKLTG